MSGGSHQETFTSAQKEGFPPWPDSLIMPATISSQATTTAQTGAAAGNTGDNHIAAPTIIRKSLPVPFTEEDLVNYMQYFSIPSSVEIRLPIEGDQVLEPRVDPSQSEGAFSPGWTSMYIESLSYGCRFPFSPFVIELLVVVNHSLGQIRPTGWLEITIFIAKCRMVHINPTDNSIFEWAGSW
ncbi:hypothetical protein LIER_33802 [Lithospermum erythrorhizon]|uniref:Uncharacterized protein n=1 Tax=Lithospermum erythrorhizon TaxID=34254 RepID=A0AAV3S1F6_LITER